jgi:hypothetical protein
MIRSSVGIPFTISEPLHLLARAAPLHQAILVVLMYMGHRLNSYFFKRHVTQGLTADLAITFESITNIDPCFTVGPAS